MKRLPLVFLGLFLIHVTAAVRQPFFDSFEHLNTIISAALMKCPKDFDTWILWTDQTSFADFVLRILHDKEYKVGVVLRDQNSDLEENGVVIALSQNISDSHGFFVNFKGRLIVLSTDTSHVEEKIPFVYLRNHTSMVLIDSPSTFYTVNYSNDTFKRLNISQVNTNVTFGNDEDFLVVRTFNCSLFSVAGPLDADGQPEWVDGFEFRLFKEVASRLNWKWKFKMSSGHGWVYRNSSYKPGLYNDMRNGDGDIGFCQMWVLQQAYGYQEYVPFWDIHCLRFLVPRPVLTHMPWTTIVTVIKPLTWLIILVVSGLTAAMYHYISGYTKTQEKKTAEDDAFQVLTVLTQNNFPPPRKIHGLQRPLMVSWVYFSFLMGIFYSSELIRLMAGSQRTPVLKTVDDIVKSKCKWGDNTFDESIIPIKAKRYLWGDEFWDLYVPSPPGPKTTLGDYDCYCELGESFSSVFFVPGQYVGPIYSHMQASSECLLGHLIGYSFKEGSKYTEPFSVMIHRLREHGLMGEIGKEVVLSPRFSSYFVNEAFIPTIIKQTSYTPLNITATNGAFFLIFIGLLLSFCVFIAELGFGYLKTKPKRPFKTNDQNLKMAVAFWLRMRKQHKTSKPVPQ